MSDLIRPATLDDVLAIAALMEAVWPDEPVETAWVRAALVDPAHATFMALAPDGRPVGFADGFTTSLPNGRLRWELDLVAMLPEVRGHGLGTRLIHACTDAGEARGAANARALIRVGNTASERAFAKAGYAPEEPELSLYIQLEISERALKGMTPVPVQTMRYQGVWLEGPIGRPELVADMHGRRVHTIGVLIRHDDVAAHETALAADFLPSGDFRWWVRSFL